MLKGFSVQQVLAASGSANSVLFLNGSGVVTGSNGFNFDGSNLLVGRTAALGGGANRELLINTASAGQIAGLNLAVNGTLAGVFHSTTSYSYAGTKTNAPFLLMANDGERCRVPAEGGFVVGTAAIATGASNGFLYVPSCAGAPTGTPTAYTGRVPIVVDTTNNKLYFYSGGSWRDAGP